MISFFKYFEVWPPLWRHSTLIWTKTGILHICRTSKFPHILISGWETQKWSQFLNIFIIWPPLWRQLGRYWKCPFLTKLGENDVTMGVKISTYLKTDFTFASPIYKLVCTEIWCLSHFVQQNLKMPLAQTWVQWHHNGGQIFKIFKNWLHFWISCPEISRCGNFDVSRTCVWQICEMPLFAQIRAKWLHFTIRVRFKNI